MSVMSNTIKTNLSTLVAFMQANAISTFNASYEGAGDSGELTDITLVGDDGETKLNIDSISPPLPYIQITHHYCCETGRFRAIASDEPKMLSVSSFLDSMVDDLIDHCGYRGYENNDGGSGFLVVHADGSVNLDHTYMVPETETHAFTLAELSTEPQDGAMSPEAATA